MNYHKWLMVSGGILIIILFPLHAQNQPQNKFTTGLDLPSGFFAGIDHQFSDFSLGFDVSTWLGMVYPVQYLGLTADTKYFLGKPDGSGRKTWFANGRIIYFNIFEKYSNKPVSVSFVPGIGKEFNITPVFGISVLAGMDFTVYTKDREDVNIPTGTYYEMNSRLKPSLKFVFQYRF